MMIPLRIRYLATSNNKLICYYKYNIINFYIMDYSKIRQKKKNRQKNKK